MTDTDRAALFAACLDQPDDDTARGVYADLLRERDDPAEQALGRFVWAGVTLARYRGNEPTGDRMFFDAQRELNEAAPQVLSVQLAHLLAWQWGEYGWDQGTELPDRVTAGLMPPPTHASRRVLRQMRENPAPAAAVEYQRGMLTAVRLPLRAWLERAGGLLASAPLRRVEVLEVPGLTLHVEGPGDDAWRLRVELSLPGRVGPIGRVTGGGADPVILHHREPSGALFPSRPYLVAAAARWSKEAIRTLWLRAGENRWPGPPIEDLLPTDWPETAA